MSWIKTAGAWHSVDGHLQELAGKFLLLYVNFIHLFSASDRTRISFKFKVFLNACNSSIFE
jgi:hypothetical protein